MAVARCRRAAFCSCSPFCPASCCLAFLSWACSWCARDLHGHAVQAAILRDQCTAIDADHFAVWEARTQAPESDRIVDSVAIGRPPPPALDDPENRKAPNGT